MNICFICNLDPQKSKRYKNLSKTLAYSGTFWLTLADSGWLCLTLADSGWLLLTLADSGLLKLILANSDRLWLTLADYGWLWLTLTDSGGQSESSKVIQSRSESARVSRTFRLILGSCWLFGALGGAYRICFWETGSKLLLWPQNCQIKHIIWYVQCSLSW